MTQIRNLYLVKRAPKRASPSITPQIKDTHNSKIYEGWNKPIESKFKFDVEQTADLPKKPPTSALYLGSVAWSFSPMHDRVDEYYISRTKDRQHWLLWTEYEDNYERKAYRIFCISSADYKSHRDAGQDMLERSWSWGKKHDYFTYPEIPGEGELELEEIADKVWESDNG